METYAAHRTESAGGREYPLTVTRQAGVQEIASGGKRVTAEAVTTVESPLGTSRCFTRTAPEATPEARAENLRQVRETAAQAMIDLGVW